MRRSGLRRAPTAPRPFKLFLYRNPDKPRQAFETIAYGFATVPGGERCFLAIVDTAANKAAIDRSTDDFLTVLKGPQSMTCSSRIL